MGNGEMRREEGPFEEQTTFYNVEWALHVVRRALPRLLVTCIRALPHGPTRNP